MGQKVNPISLRLGKTNKNYNSLWYGELNYGECLKKEILSKNYLEKFLIQIGETPGEIGVLSHPKREKILSSYLLVDSSRIPRSNRFRLKNFSLLTPVTFRRDGRRDGRRDVTAVTPFLTLSAPFTPFQSVTSFQNKKSATFFRTSHSTVRTPVPGIDGKEERRATSVSQARILPTREKGELGTLFFLLWVGFLFRLSLLSLMKKRKENLKYTRRFQKGFFLKKDRFPQKVGKNGRWSTFKECNSSTFHLPFSFWKRWKNKFPVFVLPKLKTLDHSTQKVHNTDNFQNIQGCLERSAWSGSSFYTKTAPHRPHKPNRLEEKSFSKGEKVHSINFKEKSHSAQMFDRSSLSVRDKGGKGTQENRWTAPTLLSFHLESMLESISRTPTTIYFWNSFWDGASAIFLAREIAFYLQKRVPFSKIRREILREISENRGKVWNSVEGIRVSCSGRSGGRSKKAQRGKSETFYWGRNSSSLFLSRVGFAKSCAVTQMGLIGVKVWISYK